MLGLVFPPTDKTNTKAGRKQPGRQRSTKRQEGWSSLCIVLPSLWCLNLKVL